MNIFLLDKDPVKAAQYHNDVHLNKMLIETCQLLCNAHHTSGTLVEAIPYKCTHVNHPSSVWIRSSLSNYRFGVALGNALVSERGFRGFNESKCAAVVAWCQFNMPKIEDLGLTVMQPAVGYELLSNSNDDTVQAYRNYHNASKQGMYIKQRSIRTDLAMLGVYRVDKYKPYKWTKRFKPSWFVREWKHRFRISVENNPEYVYVDSLEQFLENNS